MALRTHPQCGAFLLLLVVCAGSGGSPQPARIRATGIETRGSVARVRPSRRPAVEAAFARESYPRGAVAALVITSTATRVSVQLFRAGTESRRIGAHDVMLGTAVTQPRFVGAVSARRVLRLRIGHWPSGLYYARLQGPAGRVGYAPFVLRPRRLGEHIVAVVLPTFTWQAYNFRDDDGDGNPDTWYAGLGERTVRLARPFENRGVPAHYKYYDQPFLRWIVESGHDADFFADSDLDRIASGRALARAYELIIFPGHHEYVTRREYDAIEAFQRRGGNLAFLSANNFFWRVDLTRNTITRVAKWRDLGRPEAALIGVQYLANDRGVRKAPWVVRNARAAPWLFARTGFVNGSTFSRGGVEIDSTTGRSPRGTRVLADIRNLFGPGRSAQMTYYETQSGAKVFAAGAFMLVRDLWQPPIGRMMDNLWTSLARDPDTAGAH